MNTMYQQVSQEIVNGSWKIIFASNQAAFDALWTATVETAKGLGFDELYAWQQEQAKELYAAQQEFIAQFN
jgi:hypothetical protein